MEGKDWGGLLWRGACGRLVIRHVAEQGLAEWLVGDSGFIDTSFSS